MSKKLRSIPSINYVYLGIVFLVTLFILYYIYLWYETYANEELNSSIMNDYLMVINYNELDDYIMENKDAVIYVSKLGDESINRFERKFKNVISSNNLRNAILYMDVSSENMGDVYNKMSIDGELPYLVVYTGGSVTDTYSIAKTGYSVKKVENYLNRIGIVEVDD